MTNKSPEFLRETISQKHQIKGIKDRESESDQSEANVETLADSSSVSSPTSFTKPKLERQSARYLNGFDGFTTFPEIKVISDEDGLPVYIDIKATVKKSKDIQTVHQIIKSLIKERLLIKYYKKLVTDISIQYTVFYSQLGVCFRDQYKNYYTALRLLDSGNTYLQITEQLDYCKQTLH